MEFLFCRIVFPDYFRHFIECYNKRLRWKIKFFKSFIYPFTTHTYARLSANCAGKQRQIPISGLQRLYLHWIQKLLRRYHIGKLAAFCVSKNDLIAHIQILQASKMRRIVVPRNNHNTKDSTSAAHSPIAVHFGAVIRAADLRSLFPPQYLFMLSPLPF